MPTCFYPNGNPSPADRACNTTATHSWCCNENDTCLDNGLCYDSSQDGFLSRGTCTDAGWTDDNCPQYCRAGSNAAGDFAGKGVIIIPCGLSKGGGSACCDFGCNCSSSFPLPAGKVLLRSASSSASLPPSTTTVVRTVTATPSGLAAAASSCPANLTASTAAHDAAIGAGVGVPLGLALVVALGFLYKERRRGGFGRGNAYPGPRGHVEIPMELDASQQAPPAELPGPTYKGAYVQQRGGFGE